MATKKKTEKMICTSCGLELELKNFAPSYSFSNRKNKKMTICKTCCGELYDRKKLMYQDEHMALYRFCMELNIYYNRDLAEKQILQSASSQKNAGYLYVSKMGLVQYRDKTFETDIQFMNIYGLSSDELENLMYINTEKVKEEIKKESKKIITPEIISRWGDGLEQEDYLFLEDRYNTMLQAYDDSNPSSLWTYQEICMNYLSLRKERGNPTAQKNYQEVISKLQADCKMKLSQIDGSDDEEACMGKFIDKIENYEPCDMPLPFFRDIDRIRKYIGRFFTQPFAREHGLAMNKYVDDDIEDYQDINKIYEEVENQQNHDNIANMESETDEE